MSWEDIIKQADCKVKVCDATNCMYNAYTKSGSTFQKRCTLDEITINSSGGCNQFRPNRMAGNVGANLGSRGLIDRAKRNLQEEKRTR